MGGFDSVPTDAGDDVVVVGDEGDEMPARRAISRTRFCVPAA